jgi:hypothetical protein
MGVALRLETEALLASEKIRYLTLFDLGGERLEPR